MAEYRLPHEIYYDTKEPVSVPDVIESLLGTESILTEIGPLLETCIPGITVERIQVTIKEITEGSLKEVVWAAIFIAFQSDLEKEVPDLLQELFGTKIGHDYPTITTVFFLLLLFYGADFVYHRLSGLAEGSAIRSQLNGLIREVSEHCKMPEDRLRGILAERYGHGRMRSLVRATLRVFRPSKQHNNSSIRIGGRPIGADVVAEVPGDAQMLEYDDAPKTKPLENVEIELHAQDIDHTKSGWAAIIPSFSKERMRMEIYPPIRPIDIYTKTKIRGDVIVVSKFNKNNEEVPSICYLVRLKDQPA
jgi:hypothetical protein